MAHDIVIRGGMTVDGRGGEPVAADVAIDNGLISIVGKVTEKGQQEINARGMTVTPGFIDMHTHLDAQVCWDPELSPVSSHGVTTAMMGNCGVGFAPCKPEDRPLLAGMLETVEDIPRKSILEGLPWDWVDYGGYLDSVERIGPGINIAGLIGHSALRYFVMGERAVEEQATPEEQKEMARLVGEAIDRGAVGFSSNRFHAHRIPDGRSVPGTTADLEELVLIGKEVAKRDALYQTVGMTGEHMRHVLDKTGARMLFNNTLQGFDDDAGKKRLAYTAQLAEGRDVSSTAQVHGSGALVGLQGLIPHRLGEAWQKLSELEVPDKLAAIRKAPFREQLITEARAFEGEWTNISWMYYLGNGASPDHSMGDHNRLTDMAKAAGEYWAETFLRLSDETDGRALFNLVGENQNLKALRDLFEGGVFPGVGDAGAHVGMVMDAGWSTFVLSHWVREDGLFTMGEAVRRLTSASARILGLKDRGVLVPGMRADINVFDAETVAETFPYRVSDLPAGASRLTGGSVGYKATLVNGQLSLLNGELTGNRAGTVIRHGQ